MKSSNNADRLRKEVLIRTARALLENDDRAELDRIPLDMRPRGTKSPSRCCLYRDRAVIRYRCMAALGFSVEKETDELRSLGDYGDEAFTRSRPEGEVLTLIDEACSACIQTRYTATDVCRGCVAQSCIHACPKGAIEMRGGRAWINPESCINCGLCMKACAYSAIIKVPIPCEEACPTDAITKDPDTGREKIDHARCISCGKCLRACPFGAIAERSQMVDVIRHLKEGSPLILLTAPSVAGQFPGTAAQFQAAVERLGFSGLREVAHGADETARHEAEELLERLDQGAPFMTTSCCPAYVEAVEKVLPEMKPFVSHTPTPLQYTARAAKAESPGSITVFAGPCIAKRVEGMREESVDYVITFEELGALLIAAGIDVLECPEGASSDELLPSARGRGFAVSGGVTAAVEACAGDCLKPVSIDGLDRAAVKQLRSFACKGSCPGNFVEVMVCEGGCVAGPGAVVAPRISERALKKQVAAAG
ncbi:Fe-hydrogenase large subunit family protein [Alkalispirochaeta sphaeroplastigenens]|uniref:Fe-hydrogenase large subunit family protein n=1 Tax=Alkalispirochaeta sphaeroplastigenens TaxID=1187066 RepID=A0A2S4K0A6_9SPIO|nr:monomeric [FeFe] hydrogenase [Alkalispirochaeta sphaeroplastigenens]POR05193.1 Fe-hydrogenase large subunit family protein [Alkalispirochaeta sphaeroplastigenens]